MKHKGHCANRVGMSTGVMIAMIMMIMMAPAYSHQSKSHHGGVLTVMIMVGICHRRIPTIEYNDDDDNDNEKNRTTDISTFQCRFPPIENKFFVRVAQSHGREVFERQDTILETDQLGINMEDNIMSLRTELQKRTKKYDDI